jgi:hypothetical protein
MDGLLDFGTHFSERSGLAQLRFKTKRWVRADLARSFSLKGDIK